VTAAVNATAASLSGSNMNVMTVTLLVAKCCDVAGATYNEAEHLQYRSTGLRYLLQWAVGGSMLTPVDGMRMSKLTSISCR